MKARHFVGVLIALLCIVGLSLWSNIINIGHSLDEIYPTLSIPFYMVIIGIILMFIIIPIIRTIFTPEIKSVPIANVQEMTPTQLTEYIKRLKLTKEEEHKVKFSNDRYATVEQIIKNRESKLKTIVKNAAIDVYLITGISQNGSLDIIANLAINFKLINKIIRQVGFRPSLWQLLKIYTAVISSSLIVTAVDDMLENINIGDILGTVGKIVLQSAANGAMNALVCLRVGYVTIKYLEAGSKEFKNIKTDISKQARVQARKALPDILLEGTKRGFNAIADS